MLLAGSETLDATRRTAPGDIAAMTARGQCFTAATENAQVVYVMTVSNGIAWIDATKGAGPIDWAAHLLPIIEAQAKGCRAVGFQTRRAGLVKKAQKQGYKITGWTLEKTL